MLLLNDAKIVLKNGFGHSSKTANKISQKGKESAMTEKNTPELVTFVVHSNNIPEGMKPKPSRKKPSSWGGEGEIIAQSEKNDVSISSFLVKLLFDYRLVDSYYEKSWEFTSTRGRWTRTRTLKKYYILSYVFARGTGSCTETLVSSLWQVRVYKNPLFRDDEVVPGEFTLSINCNRRRPLYDGDGLPVMVWNTIGLEKVPLEPATHLTINGGIASFSDDSDESDDGDDDDVISW